MSEKIDEVTPTSIVQLFMLPYIEFSKRYGGKNKRLLDCACGNGYQRQLLKDRFGSVSFVDKDIESVNDSYRIDLEKERLPFLDNEFDVVFSFETIEHLPEEAHLPFIDELLRVTNDVLVIGSISKDGPNYVGQDVIFKKALGNNPYHKKERATWEWKGLFNDLFKVSRFHHSILGPEGFTIVPGLTELGFSNYVVIRKGESNAQ